jgi:DNA-directed RNA polymerase subunit RPC12/RpoP
MWHTEPKNDEWREVHLAHVESLGNRLWLRCNACGHSITLDPREFAHQHHLDMKTPLLSVAQRLKCTHCNERKAHCWPEPYVIEMKVP